MSELGHEHHGWGSRLKLREVPIEECGGRYWASYDFEVEQARQESLLP